jgi:hypothetical protein
MNITFFEVKIENRVFAVRLYLAFFPTTRKKVPPPPEGVRETIDERTNINVM